jgi:hypothetical protein
VVEKGKFLGIVGKEDVIKSSISEKGRGWSGDVWTNATERRRRHVGKELDE